MKKKAGAEMKLIYNGKTKDVYALEDGNILLRFKDDVTGENGVFDPGANTVGLKIEGAGKSGLRFTSTMFKILADEGVKTHMISADIDKAEMIVHPITQLVGKGLEAICRFRAVGSFWRRYAPILREEGQPLDAIVEFTLKDDERGDPPISGDSLVSLGIVTADEIEYLKAATRKIAVCLKGFLAKKGLELYDMKVEFGRDAGGDILLIDEISAGCLRAYRDGEFIMPLELDKIIFS